MDQARQQHTTGWTGQDVRLTRALACCTALVRGALGEAILSVAQRKQDVSVENYVTTDHQIRSLPSHQQ
jgi:hypothetical protein